MKQLMIKGIVSWQVPSILHVKTKRMKTA